MLIAVDTETYGDITEQSVHHPSIRMSHISWFNENGKGDVYDTKVESHREDIRKFGARILANPNHTKLFWNAPFDIPVLRKYGFKIRGPVYDVKVLAQIIMPNEPFHGLKHFSQVHLNVPYNEEKELKVKMKENSWSYGDVPLIHMYEYALLDAKCTFELYAILKGELDRHDMWPTFMREMSLMQVLIDMEENGITIDRKECQRIIDICTHEIKEARTEVCRLTHPDFNPGSNTQVAKEIYRNGTVRRYTKSGNPSVDGLALLQAGTDLSRAVHVFRKATKTKNTYASNILLRSDNDSILHTSFNQAAARTGRLSSSNPNLQNLPRPRGGTLGDIRRCFVPRSGRRLVFIDYDQIELRLCAHFSQEEVMLNSIREGLDLHGETAKHIFNADPDSKEWKRLRYLAKTLNFAILYGTGKETFCETVLKDTNGEMVISTEDAFQYIYAWKEGHPGVMSMINRLDTEIAETGGIRNYYNRYCPIPGGESYKAANYLIQGTAADLIKERMIMVSSFLKSSEYQKTLMVLTVHDELIFDVPKEEKSVIPKILNIMEEKKKFLVPLTCSVETGISMAQKKSYAVK